MAKKHRIKKIQVVTEQKRNLIRILIRYQEVNNLRQNQELLLHQLVLVRQCLNRINLAAAAMKQSQLVRPVHLTTA